MGVVIGIDQDRAGVLRHRLGQAQFPGLRVLAVGDQLRNLAESEVGVFRPRLVESLNGLIDLRRPIGYRGRSAA